MQILFAENICYLVPVALSLFFLYVPLYAQKIFWSMCGTFFPPHFLKMERYLFTNEWSGQSWFLYFPSLLACLWLFIFLGAAFLNDFIYTIFQRCCSLSKWYDINKKNVENSEPKKVLLYFSLMSGRKSFSW